MKKVKKSEWGGGRVTEVAGMKLTPMDSSKPIKVDGKSIKNPKTKPKTLKELQAECKKRNIGFMTSWTKMALIRRLEDEDKKEAEIQELKKLLEEKEILHNREKQKAITKKEAEKQELNSKLRKNKGKLSEYRSRIKKIMDEKFELMQKEQKVRHEIEQLEILIKSLI